MKSTAAVIDFGTSKVVTLVAKSSGYHRCDIVGAGTASYDGFMDGCWNNPDGLNAAIAESLKSATEQCGTMIRQIYIGVPGEFCKVYLSEVSMTLQGGRRAVTSKDINDLLALAEEKITGKQDGIIIHRAPAWFNLNGAYDTMEPVGEFASEIRTCVSFMIAEQSFLDDLVNRMQELGVEISGFFSSSMGEALLYLPENERDSIAALIDVGYLNTEVMLMRGDAMLDMRVIPVGGGHITADLCYGLELTMDEAEKIKRSFPLGQSSGNTYKAVNTRGEQVVFTHAQVKEILEPRVDELAQLISEALNDSGVHLGSEQMIYLSGGGLAMMNGAVHYLGSEDRLGHAVRLPKVRAPKLEKPMYNSVTGLLDLVISTLEQDEDAGLWNKLIRKLKKDNR